MIPGSNSEFGDKKKPQSSALYVSTKYKRNHGILTEYASFSPPISAMFSPRVRRPLTYTHVHTHTNEHT